jgi:hypothetical protein
VNLFELVKVLICLIVYIEYEYENFQECLWFGPAEIGEWCLIFLNFILCLSGWRAPPSHTCWVCDNIEPQNLEVLIQNFIIEIETIICLKLILSFLENLSYYMLNLL